ncbi:C40 family peptidase [Amycolatopsis sp. cmx-4-61]|uniref:C40 family peptidase n=1 Tax=Amycolatopsis sp. cmx-4-61 TaxID=2790937 RepID=UPI00397B98FB
MRRNIGMSRRGATSAARGMAVACVATIVLGGQAAAADPPTSVADLLLQYYDLSRDAEVINEQLLAAEERSAEAQTATVATGALLDRQLAGWTRRRTDFAKITATAAGDRSYVIAQKALEDQWTRLNAAGLVAARARQVLAVAQQDLNSRRGALTGRIGEVKAAIDRLPADERTLLQSDPDTSAVTGLPAGAAGIAVTFALAQRGKPYEWGAVGPDSYDCSGLVQTAYATAGVHLPRVSAEQAGVGAAVTRSDVRAGDLIFFYRPVSHVAMAIDNQRAVQAATFGQPVKISPIDAIAPITVIRRVAG